MKIILVTHPSRIAHVEKLQRHLPVMTTVVDTNCAASGHFTALKLAAQHDERAVIMEDDAIPVRNFDDLSNMWAAAHPNDLISFYLGTSRPFKYQRVIEARMRQADSFGDASILLPMLIHAVCYSVPADRIALLVERMSRADKREADFAIGTAWGAPVVYPLESLVQHRDETPVEPHPDGEPRTQPRVARRLAGPLMFN